MGGHGHAKQGFGFCLDAYAGKRDDALALSY
jgi:hypothetical protein